MEKSVLFSFEIDGKEYKLANNRNVVRNAAKKEPKLFDSLLKVTEKKEKSFSELFDEGENAVKIMETLFAYAVKEFDDDIPYENACDLFQVLYYNIGDDQKEEFSQKLMSLINNTDFIKGSNQRKANIKITF
ncbi:hypothetical protein [uncultured Coprobacter sp.]|uniref:hypothetical protein n=1 Tax=uncultured Coprobacter sp. TaxID=1720550 RepID=UPI0026065862|nr:hypothetical protein [uncultured Coprobacter sp.]